MDTKKPDPVARAARLLRESAQGLRETETLPPLHQWTGEDEAMARAAHDEYVAAADALEAWEISVGAPLRTGYDAARLEIESLRLQLDAISKTHAAAVFAIVPIEPTPVMRKAAADGWLNCDSKLILNKSAAALRAGVAAYHYTKKQS